MRPVDLGATLVAARADLQLLESAELKWQTMFAGGPVAGVTGEAEVLAAIRESRSKMKLVVELLEREVRRLEAVAFARRAARA